MKSPIFHYSGRTPTHYKVMGGEILIGDLFHDKKEFKNVPWEEEEINEFKKGRAARAGNFFDKLKNKACVFAGVALLSFP